jgi:hypothetical protein
MLIFSSSPIKQVSYIIPATTSTITTGEASIIIIFVIIMGAAAAAVGIACPAPFKNNFERKEEEEEEGMRGPLPASLGKHSTVFPLLLLLLPLQTVSCVRVRRRRL